MRTARYCKVLIAPSFFPMTRAVSATERPCRNRRVTHSCCCGFSRRTACSSAALERDSRTESSGLRCDLVGVEHLAGGHFQPETAGLEVVGDQVAGDRDQPGAEVAALPGEGGDAAQGAQERLAGEVLRCRLASHAVVDVPVHGVAVLVVQAAEGLGLTGLGALDEIHHARAVAVGCRTADGGRRRGGRSAAAGCVFRRPRCVRPGHSKGRQVQGWQMRGRRTRWGRSRASGRATVARSVARPEVSTPTCGYTGLPEAELPSRAVRNRSLVVAECGFLVRLRRITLRTGSATPSCSNHRLRRFRIL